MVYLRLHSWEGSNRAERVSNCFRRLEIIRSWHLHNSCVVPMVIAKQLRHVMGQPCRLLLVGSMDSDASLMDQAGSSFPINRDDGAICECHSQLLEAEVNSRRLQRAPQFFFCSRNCCLCAVHQSVKNRRHAIRQSEQRNQTKTKQKTQTKQPNQANPQTKQHKNKGPLRRVKRMSFTGTGET